MKKIFFLLLIFSTSYVFAVKEWTVLMFANADNDLGFEIEDDVDGMGKAINDGVTSGAYESPYVNMLAEVNWLSSASGYTFTIFPALNALGKNYRFNILWNAGAAPSQTGLLIKKRTATGLADMASNFVDTLVDSMKWAVENYPAEHYMLVFAGHSRGIYDPEDSEIHWPPRSILFDDSARKYMNNQQMIEALRRIQNEVLGGKKIDILGMDACFMNMTEINYQIKEYADYFVSNEASGPGPGWDYATALKNMAVTGGQTPLQVINDIIITFRDYYLSDVPPYQKFTHAGIDLSKIDPIIQNLNTVVSYIEEFRKLEYLEINNFSLINFVRKARSSAQEYQREYFIDLYAFYSDLYDRIGEYKQPYNFIPYPAHSREEQLKAGVGEKTDGEKKIDILRAAIVEGMGLINDAVIIVVHGTDFPRTHGLSIYFPWSAIGIKGNYPITEFAQNCKWYDFLQYYVPKINRQAT